MVAVRVAGVVNEIELFQDVRSFGSAEGCWRIFNFDMSGRAPPVVRLPVHLPRLQRCCWPDGTEVEAAEAGPPDTELTTWFEYIKAHPEARMPVPAVAMTDASPGAEAWSAKYPDFPERFRYDKKAKKWIKRRQFDALGYIGRVYHVPHVAGEKYYLRMLLHHVPACDLALNVPPPNESAAAAVSRAGDAFSFEAFKYHDGVKLETYKAVCAARALLQDDAEWDSMLEDACAWAMPAQIRDLFIYVLHYNQPLDPMALFEKYHTEMVEREWAGALPDAATRRARVLLDLEERLDRKGDTMSVRNMVFTDAERALAQGAARATARSTEPKEIVDELPANPAEVKAAFDAAYAKLLDSQREMVDAALAAIEHETGLCLFVDAPGGTGKTFCANALLNALRADGHIALAVASSGIAAILLELGRTFHSRCKASLKPMADQTLDIPAQSVIAQLFIRAKLILWDEGAMGNRYHLEALDRTLRYLMKTVCPALEFEPFGGKVIVICGDFRRAQPSPSRLNSTRTHVQWAAPPCERQPLRTPFVLWNVRAPQRRFRSCSARRGGRSSTSRSSGRPSGCTSRRTSSRRTCASATPPPQAPTRPTCSTSPRGSCASATAPSRTTSST